jgi:hypothetical protein
MKTIDQIPQRPMDAWQVADHLFGKEAVAKNHLLASKAAEEMRKAGWIFLEYDPLYGEEVWGPPGR